MDSTSAATFNLAFINSSCTKEKLSPVNLAPVDNFTFLKLSTNCKASSFVIACTTSPTLPIPAVSCNSLIITFASCNELTSSLTLEASVDFPCFSNTSALSISLVISTPKCVSQLALLVCPLF